MFDAFEIVLLLLLGDSMDLFWCLSFLDCVVLVKVMTIIHFLLILVPLFLRLCCSGQSNDYHTLLTYSVKKKKKTTSLISKVYIRRTF